MIIEKLISASKQSHSKHIWYSLACGVPSQDNGRNQVTEMVGIKYQHDKETLKDIAGLGFNLSDERNLDSLLLILIAFWV